MSTLANPLHISLRVLVGALDIYIDGSADQTWCGECEPIWTDHEVHSAVVSLEQHFGGSLPEDGRTPWKGLVRYSREKKPESARVQARELRDWVRKELRSLGTEDDAYVPAAWLLTSRDEVATAAKMTRFLDKHTLEVRQAKPSPNRRLVHAGDWHRWWKRYDDEKWSHMDLAEDF